METYEYLSKLYKYCEDGTLFSLRTNTKVGKPNAEGYIRIRLGNGKELRAHRIIWILCNMQEIPEGYLIDHIDGNKANNLITNLRLATRSQNNYNSKGRSKLGLPRGVQITDSNNYRAKIHYQGQYYDLGTYNTVEEAGAAYQEAAEILHGEFFKE